METKKCTICKESKLLCEFNKNKTTKDGFNNLCRECSKSISKKYYQENRERHKKIISLRNKKLIKENRQKLFDFYKNNKCIDCGNSNPIVLELDHKDDVRKTSTISNMIHSGISWKKIEEEISKCEVRCANCHRIRTSIQFGWYKDLNT
jgi:hypothetical protein